MVSYFSRDILRRYCDSCCRIESAEYEIDDLRQKIYGHDIVSGSGFLIDHSCLPSVIVDAPTVRFVLTNFHVVDGCVAPHDVLLFFNRFGKQQVHARVVRAFPQLDLAVIRSEDPRLAELPCIPVLPTIVPIFTKAFALGYPLASHDVQISEGNVSGWDEEHIQLNMSINDGNSGGPIIVAMPDGELGVVAVSVASANDSEAIAFGIPLMFLPLYQMCVSRMSRGAQLPVIGLFPETVCDVRCGFIFDEHRNDVLMIMGFRAGDHILQINNMDVDAHGELSVPWRTKVHWMQRNVLYGLVANGGTAVVMRGTSRQKLKWPALPSITQPVIREKYPAYEDIKNVVVGPLILCDLSLNIIKKSCEQHSGSLATYLVHPIKRHSAAVVISDVDVHSLTHANKMIRAFDIVTHVDETPVTTIASIAKKQSKIKSLTINHTLKVNISQLK